ncbi:aspartyl/asparaginyl beta-hydroxylase domain-containing protein [Francisella sp. SYW-9]|uniref:aspartyl/asparaginyl beta-hydroxylase domain-containing protein n=1 Tax=Francisella sp. SYW-9 TaxID=2610888 RepID=UPI00123DEBFC|nr:aspartyl/asparaginyl beta-hydroxylase domain-containing protein [Francisella sp. SYW-9]
MSEYDEYHKNPADYAFLNVFTSNWETLKKEYNEFIADNNFNFERAQLFMTPRSNTLKAKKGSIYSAFTLYCQGLPMDEFIKEFKLQWPDISNDEIEETLEYLEKNHFHKTRKIIKQAEEASDGCLRNVLFSVLKPGTDIKLHVNWNPHMYRGYLGLQVPEGDIAMKICGEHLKWHNGEMLVLDHSLPHCPHNRTEEPRIALVIDFLKPDMDRQEMLDLEKKLMNERMQDNPLGLGIFTTEDKVSDDVFIKYGLEHQLTWDSGMV